MMGSTAWLFSFSHVAFSHYDEAMKAAMRKQMYKHRDDPNYTVSARDRFVHSGRGATFESRLTFSFC